MTLWRTFRNHLSDKIWVAPLICALVGAVLAVVLGAVHIEDEFLSRFLWPGDNAAAANMLSFIASSTLTVLTTTISMTLIVLQVASGQFSHQLLRDYIQSHAIKGILSVFVATFTYSIMLLRTVESESVEEPPQIAVTMALILTALSLGTFVWYLSRVVSMVRVDSIIETSTQRVERLYKKHRTEWDEPQQAPDIPEDAVALRAHDSGYVRSIDPYFAAKWADAHDVSIVYTVTHGDGIITGQVVAWVYGHPSTPQDIEIPTNLIAIEHERVSDQDVRLGVHQLADIAIRGLSSGTNDPTTVVHAINQTISIIRTAVEKPLNSQVVRDDGKIRVFVPVSSPVDFLKEVVPPIRRYGAADPQVMVQLLRLLAVAKEGTEDREVLEFVDAERTHILHASRELMVTEADVALVESMVDGDAIRSMSRVAGPRVDLVENTEDDEGTS